MKRFFIIFFTTLFIGSTFSQEKESFIFKEIKRLPATSVKNQYKSSTCWSFCVTSFLESEIIRKSGLEYDLSEMWAVRYAYKNKAEKYVRMHGTIKFGAGGAMNDVTEAWQEYGIVPETEYPGMEIDESKHIHGEMDNVLKDYVDAIIKNTNNKLSPVWINGFDKILDTYLGDLPEQFEYKDQTYNPKSFYNTLDLNMNNYVILTSFTHHSYYEPFIMEVPDNWSWGEAYNIKIDELIQTINHSINNGYTVAWAADVSEKGFSFSNGVAIVPDETYANELGTDKEKWTGDKNKNQKVDIYSFEYPVEELAINQEIRQRSFNNYQTTDDHGMHIIGTAVDQNNTSYYIVKNSWGTDNPYNGYFYASESYVSFKTISILVNKKSIPKLIRDKLSL